MFPIQIVNTLSAVASCCVQVEDDSRGEQDALSACILQSLQKLAQRSVAFAKATPPRANRDGVSYQHVLKCVK